MARKVIDFSRNAASRTWVRRYGGVLSLAIALVAGVYFVRTVLAVNNTGVFELDGNSVVNTVDDWDRVFTNTDSAQVATFANDGALNASIFQGSGKDIQDITEWAWKNEAGGLPDKDNLLNSYAARYSVLPGTDRTGSCPNGTGDLDGDNVVTPPEVAFDATVPCVVLFFGADRYDGSGDAHMGFWFFQNQITLGNQKSGGGFTFNGVHAAGDLLILSNFTNGGTVPTINVFAWDPACLGAGKPAASCADKNLRRLANPGTASCLTSPQSDPFCAIVNNGTIDVAWPFVDKGGNNGVIPAGEFYEGGLNLSLLGLADECFSSVSAETRSSTSTDATLKDFVLGQFTSCLASMTTTPSVGAGGVVSPGSPVTDTAIVLGAGIANPPAPTGDVTFFLCNSSQLSASGLCESGGTNIGSVTLVDTAPPVGESSATSAQVNTPGAQLGPGKYCFRAEWPGDVSYPTPLVHFGSGNAECFFVRDTTSASSLQNWLPNDQATITAGSSSTVLNGTLAFQLFSGDNCGVTSGSPITGQSYSHTLTNAASPATRATSNQTFVVTAANNAGAYSWRVTFTSTDPNVLGSSHCQKTVITITN
jgi:hypothetical protein